MSDPTDRDAKPANDNDEATGEADTLPCLPSAKALEQPCPPYCVGEC